MQEEIKQVLNYFIAICELEEIRRQKNCAVREQSFELAVKFRDAEREAMDRCPSLTQLQEIREKLNGTKTIL